MDAYPNNPFSVKYAETKIATETIKWTLGATGTMKHEIVSPILTKFELGNIVAHCLTVMHKTAIIQQIVLPCIWMYFPNPVASTFCDVGYCPNRPSFGYPGRSWLPASIRHFIAVHPIDEDCYELLDYIRSVAKPRKMDVLNRQVDWMPGNNLPLTEDQLHQAFFDNMPTMWKEQFENAVRPVHNIAHADLLGFL
jgi:hypothetical protein